MSVEHFQPASARPQDILVAALKILGGVAHLSEVSAQCAAMRHPQPDPSIRRLFQQFSTDAVWSKSQKPANADDLFYSVDGVEKASGFWGLRGFAAENPAAYPIPGLKRAYVTLLDRDQTTLFSQRGIAYRDEEVIGIQVGFGPDSPYPDKLLTDGRIEHIGEGRGAEQTATGGNKGMLAAIETQRPIPVFQAVGPRGKRRYAELGSYRVVGFEKRLLEFADGDGPTDSYVFTLEPVVSISLAESSATPMSATRERGGLEAPTEQDISDEAPVPSGKPLKSSDPEAKRVALERRSKAHHALLQAFNARAKHANLVCKCTQYADALCQGNIFEMKSLEQDEVTQVRAAIGQLYHYKFIHRGLAGFSDPGLYAVFDGPIDPELAQFLVDNVNIGVIWRDESGFNADTTTKSKLPWLF